MRKLAVEKLIRRRDLLLGYLLFTGFCREKSALCWFWKTLRNADNIRGVLEKQEN